MPTAFATTPLDRTSLPQSSLDLVQRMRTNPLPWPGQFSPQLVAELLGAYARPSTVVLDPFVGSGTSLVEAARLGHGARGSDLNPAAVVLARVYEMINLPVNERGQVVEQLGNRLRDVTSPLTEPMFAPETKPVPGGRELEAQLVQLWTRADDRLTRNLAAALVVLCDFHRPNLDAAVVRKAWHRLQKTIDALPPIPRTITVDHADARALPLSSDTIDLILTSPPLHQRSQLPPEIPAIGRGDGLGRAALGPV